jgi:hypothetical protein
VHLGYVKQLLKIHLSLALGGMASGTLVGIGSALTSLHITSGLLLLVVIASCSVAGLVFGRIMDDILAMSPVSQDPERHKYWNTQSAPYSPELSDHLELRKSLAKSEELMTVQKRPPDDTVKTAVITIPERKQAPFPRMPARAARTRKPRQAAAGF